MQIGHKTQLFPGHVKIMFSQAHNLRAVEAYKVNRALALTRWLRSDFGIGTKSDFIPANHVSLTPEFHRHISTGTPSLPGRGLLGPQRLLRGAVLG